MDLNQEALWLWNKGRANEAVATLFKAIDEEPEQAEAYYNLINVLISAQKFSDAEAVLVRAIEKFAVDESFEYAYGNWHYQQHQYTDALKKYEEVFQRQDGVFKGEAAAMIGQCYLALQQPKTALVYLLEAELYYPTDKAILLMIGNSLLQTESFKVAENYFDKVINLEKENAEAWFKKGLTKRALQQDPEKVKYCLQKAKQIDPESFLVYVKQLKEIEAFFMETEEKQ